MSFLIQIEDVYLYYRKAMMLDGKTNTMTTLAVTENGNITGQVWYNDDMTEESKLVHAGHIWEICGDLELPEGVEADEYYTSLEMLNADLIGFSFIEEAEYPEA